MDGEKPSDIFQPDILLSTIILDSTSIPSNGLQKNVVCIGSYLIPVLQPIAPIVEYKDHNVYVCFSSKKFSINMISKNFLSRKF